MDNIVTVKSLIKYLTENFRPEQKLSFYDEGGAWIELVHVPKFLVGNLMFRYVKDKKEIELSAAKDDEMKTIVLASYRNVNDNDLVVY